MSLSNQDMVKIDTKESSKASLSPSDRIWTFEPDVNGLRSPLFVLFSSVSTYSFV